MLDKANINHNMEDFQEKKSKLNKKKVALAIIIFLLIIALISIFITYCLNSKFRKWTDKNILQKEIKQGNTVSVAFNGENHSNIYAYDKYIIILDNKVLKLHDALGTEVEKFDTEISNPIFAASGKYLVVAEENGEKIYVLEGKKMLWNAEIEGKISQVEINENGYVGIVIEDISYKNIVSIYNVSGQNLLKTYVASNKVVDISISTDNQQLAIAEVDVSGVLIQSSIRVISIEKARTNPENSIINIYSVEVGKLITNIEYQNRQRLICEYSNEIDIIEQNENRKILELYNTGSSFASIELKNNLVIVEERANEEFNSIVKINNITNNKIKTYEVEEVAKEMYTYENVIALNFGTELHIINTNGWLMKKYIANQEINKVVISNKIAGIVYRDRIEIIDL